ncbi:MCE family protein [Mycolicibacterium sp.]|uniref:MCE family protein n=1 Tax=Mycolicibacterium sp. TaxID=2320850 RepID=UPI003D125324
MRDNLAGAVTRLAVFLVVCLLAMFSMIAIFGQLRFDDEIRYRAQFSNVSGLEEGNFVRIAGVEVGKVKSVSVQPDTTVLVEFAVDPSVVLTDGNRAVIRYADLIGGRYLNLEEGAGDTRRMNPGDTIPLARTSPALDLDALIGGFRPLFRALDPDQVNALSSELIRAFQGQGPTMQSLLATTGTLANTLADRDQLIGDLIDNLSVSLGALADQNDQFDKTVVSLSELVARLADKKQAVTDSVAYGDAAAKSIADLLAQGRPPAKQVREQLDRTAGLVVADHDYMDDLLNTLPDAYQMLNRHGMYGDFFGYYLCDAILKVNGKGGQPVFIKVVEQVTGRCAPK